MIEIKYTRDGVPEDIRYFKTVNEYVNWIFAERIKKSLTKTLLFITQNFHVIL